MKIQVKQTENLKIPSREPNHDSSGYDLIATEDPKIFGNSVEVPNGTKAWKRVDWIEYHTGLFIAPQTDNHGVDYHTLIMPRSSLRKYNLTLANSIGLIDVDYRGELILCFHYLWQPEDFFQWQNMLVGQVNMDRIYKKGDAIGQLVAEAKNLIDWVVVADLNQTVRGSGGFGSREEREKTQSTQEPTKDNKTTASPLIDFYKSSTHSDTIPMEQKPSYEKMVKERERI